MLSNLLYVGEGSLFSRTGTTPVSSNCSGSGRSRAKHLGEERDMPQTNLGHCHSSKDACGAAGAPGTSYASGITPSSAGRMAGSPFWTRLMIP